MDKTLQLVFVNQSGTRVNINIPEPIEPLDPEAIQEVMDEIIDANVIVTAGGSLVGKVRAVLLTRDSEEIASF